MDIKRPKLVQATEDIDSYKSEISCLGLMQSSSPSTTMLGAIDLLLLISAAKTAPSPYISLGTTFK